MGRLLLIFLVMLLPLRGWSAERMATQMVQSQVVASIAGDYAMPADCPMMAQPASQTEESPNPFQSHNGCQTCQLCMSLAAQDLPDPNSLIHERQAGPVSVSVSFISASLARQSKPPIH